MTSTHSVSTSTNGVILAISDGSVLYTNTILVDDQFTYTVADGFCGTNSGIITLTVTVPSSLLILPPYLDGANQIALRVSTQTGFNYILLGATNLNPPVVW